MKVLSPEQIRRLQAGKPLRQVAALPYRSLGPGALEFLLITTRTTRRFIVPKGWPGESGKEWKSAAREALQEAGVVGKVDKTPCGHYLSLKRIDDSPSRVRVCVYGLRVRKELDAWPEMASRTRKWLRIEDAMLLVDEPELAPLMLRISNTRK